MMAQLGEGSKMGLNLVEVVEGLAMKKDGGRSLR